MHQVKFKHLYKSAIPPSVSRMALDNIVREILRTLIAKYTIEDFRLFFKNLTGLSYPYNEKITDFFTGHNIRIFKEAIERQVGVEWRRNIGGTFPKRLSSYFYKEFKVKLDTATMSYIGTQGSVDSLEQELFYWDIYNAKNEPWWNAGDFGDSGSCLWGDRSSARDAFEQYGFMAIRTYRVHRLESQFKESTLKTLGAWFKHQAKDDAFVLHKAGRGRAWLYYMKSYNSYVIWNGYDGEGSMSALHYARLFATMMGYTYHKIQLLNNGNDSGKIYINDATGWLIHSIDNTKAQGLRDYDFQIDIDDNGDDDEYCEDCEQYVASNDMTSVYDGNRVCSDCLEHYRDCTWTGTYYHIESGDIVYVDNNYDGILPSIQSVSRHWWSGWYNARQFGRYIVYNEDENVNHWKPTVYQHEDGRYYSEPEIEMEEMETIDDKV